MIRVFSKSFFCAVFIFFIPFVFAMQPGEIPVPVEIIQDDSDAYILINSFGDREEHYFDSEGNEERIVIIDSRGNRFETEYDSEGNVIREDMPDEIVGEDVYEEEQVHVEENDKGIVGLLYYDTKGRITKIDETFVFGYNGITEYEYYDKMQKLERDGLTGYEWVVKREVSSLVKDEEVKASIVKEFDKSRNMISRETDGLAIMFPVIALIAKVYGYEVSEEDYMAHHS